MTYDRAWKLLEDPTRWTQGVLARDKEDRETRPTEAEACKWCAFGAIVKVYGNEGKYPKLDALYAAIGPNEEIAIGPWNDAATHEEVVAKLRELDI